MPVVFHGGTRIIIRWTKREDEIILMLGKKYSVGKLVSWRRASADAAFRELPFGISRYTMAKRYAHLKLKQKGLLKRGHHDHYKNRRVSQIRRKKFFDSIPDSFKIKCGYKSKIVWSKPALETLGRLTDKYKRGKHTTNWIEVMNDPASRIFPYHSLDRVRHYYGALRARRRPGVIAKRRKNALKYKKGHWKAFNRLRRKCEKKIRYVVNAYARHLIE